MGLTWAFGIAYALSQNLILAYIFTVLNSLQGMLIFIVFVAARPEVSDET